MSFRKTKRVNKTISYNRPMSLLTVQLTEKSGRTCLAWPKLAEPLKRAIMAIVAASETGK
jgi:hypothetical protein